jgi:ribonuclease HII
VNRAKLHRPDLRVEKDLLRSGCGRLAAMDEVGRGALAGPVTVGVVVVTAGIGRVPAGLRDSKLLTPAARQQLIAPVRRWAVEWAVGHASPAEIDAFGIMTCLRLAARRALAQLSGPVDAVLLDGNHDYLNPPAQAVLFDDSVVRPESDVRLAGTPVVAVPVTVELPIADVRVTGGPAVLGGSVTADPAPPGYPVTEASPSGNPVADIALNDHPDADLPYVPVHLRIKADLRCAGVAGASVLAKTERDALMVTHSDSYPAYGWAVNKGYATPEHLAALAERGPCELHRRSWRLTGPCPGAPAGDPVVDDGIASGWQEPSARG